MAKSLDDRPENPLGGSSATPSTVKSRSRRGSGRVLSPVAKGSAPAAASVSGIGAALQAPGDDGDGSDDAATPTPSAEAFPSTATKRRPTTDDFELMCVIGMGAFGRVLQVRNKGDGKVFAMKVISKKLLRRKNSVENMVAEKEILTKVDHPFVVHMQCAFSTDSKLFLVMDYMHGGELFFHLRKSGLLLDKNAQFYVGEILLALEHLHSKGVIHRDLKPEVIAGRRPCGRSAPRGGDRSARCPPRRLTPSRRLTPPSRCLRCPPP